MAKFDGPSFVDILLEDNPTPSLCLSLTVEIVKYILYRKAQIPLPLDILRREAEIIGRISAQSSTTDITSQANLSTASQSQWKEKSILLKKNKMQERFLRRWRQFDEKWESVLTVLEDQLSSSLPDVAKEVAIILGATILSPKAAFILQFPPCYPPEEPPLRRNLDCVFKALMSSAVTEKSMSVIGLTNVHVLLKQTPNSSTNNNVNLVTRFDYSIPRRCRQTVLRFAAKSALTNDSLLLPPCTTENDTRDVVETIDREFRKLRVKQCLFQPQTQTTFRSELMEISGIGLLDNTQELLDEETSMQLILEETWYQVLPTLKGFKHLNS